MPNVSSYLSGRVEFEAKSVFRSHRTSWVYIKALMWHWQVWTSRKMGEPGAPMSRSRGGREAGSLLGGQLPYGRGGVISWPGAG